MDQMLNDQERRALAEYRTMMHPVRESAEVPAPPAEVPAQEGSAPAPVQPEERSRTVSRELEILEQFFAKVGVETGYAHGDTTYHISSYDGASGI
jgi:hypothetical protein